MSSPRVRVHPSIRSSSSPPHPGVGPELLTQRRRVRESPVIFPSLAFSHFTDLNLRSSSVFLASPPALAFSVILFLYIINLLNFFAIRAELERDFTVSKRNKTLWEVVSTRMRERGYRCSPEQCKCKWKNLVNRYKQLMEQMRRIIS